MLKACHVTLAVEPWFRLHSADLGMPPTKRVERCGGPFAGRSLERLGMSGVNAARALAERFGRSKVRAAFTGSRVRFFQFL